MDIGYSSIQKNILNSFAKYLNRLSPMEG